VIGQTERLALQLLVRTARLVAKMALSPRTDRGPEAHEVLHMTNILAARERLDEEDRS